MDIKKIAIAILVVIAVAFVLSGDLPPEGGELALRPVQTTWHQFLWNYPRFFTLLFLGSIFVLILKSGGGAKKDH